jgi:hypothetical protein
MHLFLCEYLTTPDLSPVSHALSVYAWIASDFRAPAAFSAAYFLLHCESV